MRVLKEGSLLLAAMLVAGALLRCSGESAEPAATGSTLSASDSHTCSVRSDRSLWCWGDNFGGQLGDGTTRPSAAPRRVRGDARWSSVAAGAAHTCGIQTDGSLWCWGENLAGQLGVGGDEARLVPARVVGDDDWAKVAVGGERTCALRDDGTLWCWGAGGSLVRKVGTEKWLDVSAHAYEVCAVRADHTLWCASQVDPDPLALQRVGDGATWSRVSVGVALRCATRTDASLWCWDVFEQGTKDPKRVGANVSWRQTLAVRDHLCAVRVDGSLWCTGRNDAGQLGRGGATGPDSERRDEESWLHVALNGSVSGVAAGRGHTCAETAEGAVWCWGKNDVGEVGAAIEDEYVTGPMRVEGFRE